MFRRLLKNIKKYIIKNKILSKFDLIIRIFIGKLLIFIYNKNYDKNNHNKIIKNKFLILNIGGLGDGLFHHLLVELIIKNEYELVFFVQSEYEEIFRELYVNSNIKIIGYSFGSFLKFNYDYKDYIYISTNSTFESYLFYLFSGSTRIIGYIGDYNKIRSNFLLNESPFIETKNKRQRIKNIITILEKNLILNEILSKNDKINNNIQENYIIITFMKSHKWGTIGNLSIELQAMIINLINKKYPTDKIIYVGVKEQYVKVDYLLNYVKSKYNVDFKNYCGLLNARELLKLIKNCKKVYTIDGGILHLADIYSKNVVSFFNFSDINTYHPNGKNVLKSYSECSPCKIESNYPVDGYPINCKYSIKCSYEYNYESIKKIIDYE